MLKIIQKKRRNPGGDFIIIIYLAVNAHGVYPLFPIELEQNFDSLSNG